MWEFYNCLEHKQRRKDLRINATKAEKIFWFHIRSKKLGVKFRRQHGIDKYIVDFYCPELRLIVELDGGIHGEKPEIEKDEVRENFLRDNDFFIKRYTNEEIFKNLDGVLIDLDEYCKFLRDKLDPT